jgi:hypothetical protein
MPRTQLASGKITNADAPTIELVEPPDLRPGSGSAGPRTLNTGPAAYANAAANPRRCSDGTSRHPSMETIRG